ncbi:phosphate acyltransferase PlsX [Acidaminobacter sp.]|uniref:phosphate acyltransferase PlsX n=1 Tax=Acidaminobacter sp. TaxID=1872102 RepID=UPI001383E365|nr:phosphate acyltransferase PlsX [Acidaminobacter sp.]MDK9709608.1 phosphate acyltransferase PlsX [Acidaminobacter sp.]MZQ96480.1 phosphate acyltransferase PlsX [Acidaminobacter sp.]
MRIGIDAMGGDHAPEAVVKGAVEALSMISADLVLIGMEDQIKAQLASLKYDANRLIIHHASEVIENEDKPVRAIKSKKDASMVVGFEMLKNGSIDALLSAGNTGALLAGGLLKVGRIKGLDRPALCLPYPTSKGFSVLIDAGSNADCKPHNLYEFAVMGTIYARDVLGIENPTVGIANIGTEEGKGNILVVDAYPILKASDLNFIGNIEARDIPDGVCDVIVCDGFTGNIILKLSEGVASSFSGMLKAQLMKTKKNMLLGMLLKGVFTELKKKLDYTEYGGAPFLGTEGLIVKAHGSSNAKAIKNAIRYAEVCVKSQVVERIREELGRKDLEAARQSASPETQES